MLWCSPFLFISFYNAHSAGVGLGPASNALTAKFDEEDQIIITGKYNGGMLWPVTSSSSLQSGIWLVITLFTKGSHNKFKVNDDGTISPMGYQHLVLGFQVPGLRDSKHENVTSK